MSPRFTPKLSMMTFATRARGSFRRARPVREHVVILTDRIRFVDAHHDGHIRDFSYAALIKNFFAPADDVRSFSLSAVKSPSALEA